MASRTAPTRPGPPASLAYMTVQSAFFSAWSWTRQWKVNRDQVFATAVFMTVLSAASTGACTDAFTGAFTDGSMGRPPVSAAASSRAASRRNASYAAYSIVRSNRLGSQPMAPPKLFSGAGTRTHREDG